MNQPLEMFLFASGRASAHFALTCLEPYNGHLRAKSSFVKPDGEIMHWHDFGDLEGPGWAANVVGGAHLLWRWARFVGDPAMQAAALALLDHVLEDGFIDGQTGFIWPYFDLAQMRHCLNYVHRDDWLCPGSLAKIGVQLLDFADDLAADCRPAPETPAPGQRAKSADAATLAQGASRLSAMRAAAADLAAWLFGHISLLPNGWVPRRTTADGQPFELTPHGQPDPIYDHSADGLFLLELAGRLAPWRERALALGEAFVAAGGLWGSINHDTYDDHESVAYACAFRILRRAADLLDRPAWRAFAYQEALPALARFRMAEDRNGVTTAGLLWMEETWDTAYLWENAEVAHAYLEAWAETGDAGYRDVALGILAGIARHHYGAHGFLTEGVDWNNHVGQQHHVNAALYGAIQYTEPLLNNLHFLGPTLTCFAQIGYRPPTDLDDAASIALVRHINTEESDA